MLGMIGGGIQALGGLAQAASGIFGKKKRQRRLESLLAERPQYEIPKEISQDLELTRKIVRTTRHEKRFVYECTKFCC